MPISAATKTAIERLDKYADWLDDLLCRFLLFLPKSEQVCVERFWFHLEEACWFFYDFCQTSSSRAHNSPPSSPLPNVTPSMLLEFCHAIAKRPAASLLPLLRHPSCFPARLTRFERYKTSIPVYGMICLHARLPRVLMCKLSDNLRWTFPQGKRLVDETDHECALRECWEETGLQLPSVFGDAAGDPLACITECTQFYHAFHQGRQPVCLFVCFISTPLSEAAVLQSRGRGEVACAAWKSLRWLFRQLHHHNYHRCRSRLVTKAAVFANKLEIWLQARRACRPPIPNRSLSLSFNNDKLRGAYDSPV